MAGNFVAKRCTQCGGVLIYERERKLFICESCGTQYERREENREGMFALKNVVRQTILETTYRRLDNAQRNLVECEKIDAKYVGTLVAKIVYLMIKVTTPGTCLPHEARGLFEQMKRSYLQLREEYPDISSEEEFLYEDLEESDIYATLILVFDSLGDKARRDLIRELIKPSEVYSQDANTNLLAYALKNDDNEFVDAIIANYNNLNVKLALTEILKKQSDVESKASNVSKLLSTKQFGIDDKRLIEDYIETSQDSGETKAGIAAAAVKNGVNLSLDIVTRNVLSKVNKDQANDLISAYCTQKLNDSEVLKILTFSFASQNAEVMLGALECLEKGNQYVYFPSKLIVSVLDSMLSASDKIAVIEKAYTHNLEQKTQENALTSYLCFSSDDKEERYQVIPFLLGYVSNIPSATVESYILKCGMDEEYKPELVEMMFDKGLNLSYYRDLITKYLKTTVDVPSVKSEVLNVLIDKGLRLDNDTLEEFICQPTGNEDMKIAFVNRMVENGTMIRNDCASKYLERMSASNYSAELFDIITAKNSVFSTKALENYLLYFSEESRAKLNRALFIIENCVGDIGSHYCSIAHLKNRVTCNIAQAYMLLASDNVDTMKYVIEKMVQGKMIKLNGEIMVSNERIKFKKYVVANKNSLDGKTVSICDHFKVFSLLF